MNLAPSTVPVILVQVTEQVKGQPKGPGKCPRCGSRTVERINRSNGSRFLGCSRFPACRGSRDLV